MSGRAAVGAQRRPSSSTTISATSVGVRPTRTPTASSACAFALAVPREPVTIAPAWPIVRPAGRREAGDVGDDRLVDVAGDEHRRVLLAVAADLSGHHDQLRLGVGLEEAENVDEARPGDRVSADPDDRRVAQAAQGQLVADLVGQRPRPRDDADVARAEEGRRDDPGVGLARREDAGAVRADQADAGRPVQLGVDAELVVRGDPLGDRHDRRDAGVSRLEDRVAAIAGGHEDRRSVRAGLAHGGGERVEDGDPVDVRAALARRHAGDDVRPVGRGCSACGSGPRSR